MGGGLYSSDHDLTKVQFQVVNSRCKTARVTQKATHFANNRKQVSSDVISSDRNRFGARIMDVRRLLTSRYFIVVIK